MHIQEGGNIMADKTSTIESLIASKKYDYKLLESLTQGDIWVLNDLTDGEKNDGDFMLPLLYAVKNDLDTYEVYKYCGENIQSDKNLTIEIIKNEPKLFEGTPLSKDAKFIIDNLSGYPEIIQYVSPEVKKEVTENAISAAKNPINNIGMNAKFPPEILQIVDALNNTPELAGDSEYMENAITKEASLLNFASQELKNNSDFMRKVSKNNPKVIGQVVKDISKFSLESVSAVRDVSKEFTIEDSLAVIEEKAQTSEDIRYQKVLNKVENIGKEHPLTIKFLTAMLAQNDTLEPEKVEDVLNYSILTMEKFKQEGEKDGKLEVNKDNLSQLITPIVLKKLMKKQQEQGIELDTELAARIDEYMNFYKEYSAQYAAMRREEREKNEQNSKAQKEESHSVPSKDNQNDVEKAISPQEVVDATIEGGVALSEINEVAGQAKLIINQQTKEPGPNQRPQEPGTKYDNPEH